MTGQVTASYDIAGGLGALAYDASRNAIWAGWAGGPEGDVYLIQLDASKSVVGSKVAINTCEAGECYTNIDDGLTYDAGSGTLYLSPDTATTIDHFDTSGTLLGSFDWAGQGCYNSGLAIGDQLLLEGSDGCSHIWVVDKTDPSKVVFDFSTAVAGDPNFRDEGMACDPNTFASQGEQVIWPKEAYSPMRAHAFVIPNGSCGVGGNRSPKPPMWPFETRTPQARATRRSSPALTSPATIATAPTPPIPRRSLACSVLNSSSTPAAARRRPTSPQRGSTQGSRPSS